MAKSSVRSSFLLCGIVASVLLQFQLSFSSAVVLNSSLSSRRNERALAIGDFDIVNEVFQDFRLKVDIDEPIDINGGLFGTIFIELQNLICYDISIGDILLSYVQPKETSISFDVHIAQFDTECEFDYTYDGQLGLWGKGSAVLSTSDNSLNLDALFSQSAVGIPPKNVSFNDCDVQVNVVNSTFTGGIVASVLNINRIKNLLKDVIANLVEDYIREEVEALDQKAVQLLTNLTSLIEPYLQPVTDETELCETPGSTSNLINVLEPSGTIAFGFNLFINQVSKALGLEVADKNSPTGMGKDLGINVFLRSFLLDDDRSLSLNTSSMGQLRNLTIFETIAGNIAEIEIRIDRVQILGIDTFTRIDPLERVSNYTVAGSCAWNYTAISADVYIAFGPPDSAQKVEENIVVSTTIRDLEVAFGLLLQVDESIGNVKIGDMAETANILPCFLANIEALKISSLDVSLGSIDDLVIEDFKSPGLGRVLDTFFLGLYRLYDDALLFALPIFFQTALREYFNDFIATVINESECSSIQTPSDGEFIDFRDFFLEPSKAIEYGGKGTSPYGDFGNFLRNTVDELLDDIDSTTGLPEINNIISSFLELQSGIDGTIILNTTLLEIEGKLQIGTLDAKLSFQAKNLRFENIDTMQDPIVLLEPKYQSGQELFNSIGFGVGNRPLHVATKLTFEIENNRTRARDEVEITFDLVGAELSLEILARILSKRFFSIPVVDLFEVNCWLATLPAPFLNKQGIRLPNSERTFGILAAELELERLKLNIDCITCTSTALFELSDFAQSEEASDTFTRLANTLFDFVTTLLDGEFLQTFIDRALNEAPAKCPHNPNYDPDFRGLEFDAFESIEVPNDSISSLLLAALMIVVVIFFLILFIRFIIRYIVKSQYSRWKKIASSSDALKLYENRRKEDEKHLYLNRSTCSMLRSSEVPFTARYGIPIIIFLNIALFLSGHFNLGGAVSVFIKVAGKETAIKDLFQFSIANAAMQLWEAGAVEVALLILVFSIIWPYTKQIITLFAWFLPPRILSVQKRGYVFAWLDALAKWSSVDIFFLVISLVAFNIKIESPDNILPPDFYTIDILLVPLWGLYANLIAQVLSQLSSHAIIYYHRKVVTNAMNQMDLQRTRGTEADIVNPSLQLENHCGQSSDDVEEALYQHSFKKSHYDSEHLLIRPWVNTLLIFVSLSLLALILVGSLLPSFSFEQLGIVGIIVELGINSSEAKTNFGIFSTVETLIKQAQTLRTTVDMVGMIFIATFVLLTLLVIPIVQTCGHMYQWYKKMDQSQRGQLEFFIEILSSWQYIEVYIIAVMISSWQLSSTSEYLINSYCDGLDEALKSWVNVGILKAEGVIYYEEL